ncbi:MAG: SCO family protein [Lutibacter sp.]|jgi:protein SCO1/2|nr:SCO family protein [Lutibacter sp.]
MKTMKYIIHFALILATLVACQTEKKQAQVYQCPMACEGTKTFDSAGSCGVCKMDLEVLSDAHANTVAAEDLSDTSIFNLTSTWHTEEGTAIALNDLKGKTLVMVMIYTSCKAACPRLVADMRNIEKKIPENLVNDVHFVMVSIDPETDTPERLQAFAEENYMDGEQWTFLQGTPSSVREFANVLAVKYKQITPIDFSHSNIISVFDPGGELIHQQEGLGVDNKETITAIISTVKKSNS